MSFQEDLRRRARDRPRRIVFPEGEEPRVHEALARIQEGALLHATLLGDRDRIQYGLKAAGADPDGVDVKDPRPMQGIGPYVETLLERRRARGMTPDEARDRVRDPLIRGALMVARGEVDGSVAGCVSPTADVLRAALWCVGPDEGIRTVSSAFYMVVRPFRSSEPEVLTFTDGAVVPDPDAAQLSQIAAAAARARRRVVGDSPSVAFLSYSTKGSAEGPSVTRVRDAIGLFKDMEPGVPVDGELQVDAALVEAVARRKARYSAVGGSANVLVFPNLDAGNIGYKLVERLGGATAIGPIIQGLRRPCNDLSRGAAPEDIVSVACITSLMAS